MSSDSLSQQMSSKRVSRVLCVNHKYSLNLMHRRSHICTWRNTAAFSGLTSNGPRQSGKLLWQQWSKCKVLGGGGFVHFIRTSEYTNCFILHHICCCFMNIFVLIQSQLCVNDLHPDWVNESTPCPDLKTLPHGWRTEASDLLRSLAIFFSAPPPCFP